MENRVYLNDDWKFSEQFTEEMLGDGFDVGNMTPVRLPHTAKETPLHYFDESVYQMVSGYRRDVFIPEEWKGKRLLLTIDGAAHESEVYWNGKKIGEHHCGYTAFTMDISDDAVYGIRNTLVVKVDSRESVNIPPFGFVIDYMTYGGLYREVWLDIKEKTYLKDVFVRGDLSGDTGRLISEITADGSGENLSVRQKIRRCGESGYRLLGECEMTGTKLVLDYTVESVLSWDTVHPVCYEVCTQLIRDEKVLDENVTVTGFRHAEFKADGFYLNGKKVKLRGLNRHQSYPYVGYAMPESMQRMDADILKYELGVNAVRTSHYPQSHYFIDQCDRIGLLVFMEIPGWQHIGDEAWKDQAVINVRDMVMQYRNHTSIILWGVRINESQDDDDFYRRTNAAARELDPSRPTGGVRAHKKSSLLEDVYTYNDFVHDGTNQGCEKKAAVTSDPKKPYLISEYNGHMYPTKAFDWEEHRAEHALRHVRVLDAAAAEGDIAGSFGWCMFDYNTHKDFGSGDRICYHGVMDMFRNPKLAASVYACEQDEIPVLQITSSMDIGEHPGCNRGNLYILSNADSVRMYKNDRFIKEYRPEMSPYKHLKHGPILIDDFIGDTLEKNERFRPKHAKEMADAMNIVARGSLNHIPKRLYPTALKLVLLYHIDFAEVTKLYTKYIGDWGGTATVYRFDAIKDGKVIKSVTKEPVNGIRLQAEADHTNLTEHHSYDVALVRIRAVDDHGNVLPFYQEPVRLIAEGDISIIGPDTIALQGGMGGTYVKSLGRSGQGALLLQSQTAGEIRIPFQIMI